MSDAPAPLLITPGHLAYGTPGLAPEVPLRQRAARVILALALVLLGGWTVRAFIPALITFSR